MLQSSRVSSGTARHHPAQRRACAKREREAYCQKQTPWLRSPLRKPSVLPVHQFAPRAETPSFRTGRKPCRAVAEHEAFDDVEWRPSEDSGARSSASRSARLKASWVSGCRMRLLFLQTKVFFFSCGATRGSSFGSIHPPSSKNDCSAGNPRSASSGTSPSSSESSGSRALFVFIRTLSTRSTS